MMQGNWQNQGGFYACQLLNVQPDGNANVLYSDGVQSSISVMGLRFVRIVN